MIEISINITRMCISCAFIFGMEFWGCFGLNLMFSFLQNFLLDPLYMYWLLIHVCCDFDQLCSFGSKSCDKFSDAWKKIGMFSFWSTWFKILYLKWFLDKFRLWLILALDWVKPCFFSTYYHLSLGLLVLITQVL